MVEEFEVEIRGSGEKWIGSRLAGHDREDRDLKPVDETRRGPQLLARRIS